MGCLLEGAYSGVGISGDLGVGGSGVGVGAGIGEYRKDPGDLGEKFAPVATLEINFRHGVKRTRRRQLRHTNASSLAFGALSQRMGGVIQAPCRREEMQESCKNAIGGLRNARGKKKEWYKVKCAPVQERTEFLL